VSGDIGTARHPYADHPASHALTDHFATNHIRSAVSQLHCACGWNGPACDHPAHLAEVLDRAGLLKEDDINTDCAACRDGQCQACVGYRGPLQTYLCGCYARTPTSDAERHPLTYEGQQAVERRAT
jgi:hypothetical protein